jgi:hypothetical protein
MFLGNCLIVLSRPHRRRAGSTHREVSRELLSSHTCGPLGSLAEQGAKSCNLRFVDIDPQRPLKRSPLDRSIEAPH